MLTLKQYRKSLGLTLEEFGQRLGKSKQAYSQMEKRWPGVEPVTLLEICTAFGCEVRINSEGTWISTDIYEPQPIDPNDPALGRDITDEEE